MKHAALLAFLILAAPLAQAEDKVCRTVATSWQQDGRNLRTSISAEPVNGCHRIWQSVDGAETEGADCNCDLVIDGMEGRFLPPPSAYQAERLLAACRVSVVRKPRPVPAGPSPQKETPRIIMMRGASGQ